MQVHKYPLLSHTDPQPWDKSQSPGTARNGNTKYWRQQGGTRKQGTNKIIRILHSEDDGSRATVRRRDGSSEAKQQQTEESSYACLI